MKINRRPGPWVLAFTLGVLAVAAGCSTVSSRIDAQHAAFLQLPPDQQALVRQGRVEVGSGSAAVSLAFGDPRYVTYDSEPLVQTQVVHGYGDFMIPAANLPLSRQVWHYQKATLRGIVEGDERTVTFDLNARVAVLEQAEPRIFQIGSGAPLGAATPEQFAMARAGQVAIGFGPALAELALGRPDRVTLRTDSAGAVVIWHYEDSLLTRAADRTTIQDRLALTFDSTGRIAVLEQEEPLAFAAEGGSANFSPGPRLRPVQAADGQVAIGFDPRSARRALGIPDRVTLRTDSSGRTVIWHFEAGRRVDNSAGLLVSDYPNALARFGVTLAFDESGRVSSIRENIGVRAE